MDEEEVGLYDEGAPEPEVQLPEPQQAGPDLEAVVRERYAPLEEKIQRLEGVLDPDRIQAFQREQEFHQQRNDMVGKFRQHLQDGDAAAALQAIAPQFAMWDRALLAQAQIIQDQQAWRAEREEHERIVQEVEAEEMAFYAAEPDGALLLREFVPTAARAYAELRGGPGTKATRADADEATEWMRSQFGQKGFSAAAHELAAYVRAHKAARQQVQPRRLPSAPAPGMRTSPQSRNVDPDQELIADFYST
jgi:hypothetical protein